MKQQQQTITYDKTLVLKILTSFKKEIDEEGYIIDSKTREKVLSQDGDQIKAADLGGITKGSEIYLKSDIVSLINYFEGHQ